MTGKNQRRLKGKDTMTDLEAIRKISETKALNGRFGKACDTLGLALGKRAKNMGRWAISQSKNTGSPHPEFNWSRRYSLR